MGLIDNQNGTDGSPPVGHRAVRHARHLLVHPLDDQVGHQLFQDRHGVYVDEQCAVGEFFNGRRVAAVLPEQVKVRQIAKDLNQAVVLFTFFLVGGRSDLQNVLKIRVRCRRPCTFCIAGADRLGQRPFLHHAKLAVDGGKTFRFFAGRNVDGLLVVGGQYKGVDRQALPGLQQPVRLHLGNLQKSLVINHVALVIEVDKVGLVVRLNPNISEQLQQELGLADSRLTHNGQVGVGMLRRVVQFHHQFVTLKQSTADENIQSQTVILATAGKLHLFHQFGN